MKNKIYSALCLGLLSIATPTFSQDTNVKPEEDLYVLSLEELMNTPIRSASKKDETLFDAPLSSYTIKRSDIDRAGSTSIMEALRLAPGVIVREQANGVYDIHIRGFDNILRTSETYSKSNLTTLVMIDNRPVFNHNLGGTFWEALPIDLNDVERIEIVRGPSAPLFGPNAVTGVINIITKRISNDKTLVNANVQIGNPSTTIANASVGKSFGKFSAIVSGNFQKRDRFDDTYFLPGAQDYFTIDQLSAFTDSNGNMLFPNIKKQYPKPGRAMQKFGVNGFATYAVSEKVSFDFSVGTQQSETQKIFLSNIFSGSIPFTENQTETSYANLAGKIHGLTFRSSYLKGHDNLALESSPNQYDYTTFDANAEYAIGLGKIGTLTPGLSYQSAVYGDKAYATKGLTFLNGTKQNINTTSGFIRTDLKPANALRVLAAVRFDKFSTPDKVYFAYEFATTYKINEMNLIRAAATRSNSGSFIGNNYLNLVVPIAPGLDFQRSGSANLKLLTVNMIEVGYRSQLSKSFQLDIDLFQQKAENFTALITTNGFDPGNGTFQPTEQRFLNVPTTATQVGGTVSLNFVPNEKIQIKPFITIQKTTTKDLPSGYVSTDINPGITYSKSEHQNTPGFYGGYFINYRPITKLTFNLNGYLFTAHRQYDSNDPNPTATTDNIQGKVLVNFKANWAVTKQFNLYLNCRNVLNSKDREFYAANITGASFIGGVSFNIN